MARVTVEDCVDKVESPYELVLVAKERSTKLKYQILKRVQFINLENMLNKLTIALRMMKK